MADTTTTPNDQPIGKVVYDRFQLKNHIENFSIKALHVMSCNNQSNNGTLRRWLLGGDMSVSALANVCSGVQLDLLSFFTYDGYKFQTRLENLYRFEKAGLSIEEILKEHAIEVYRDPGDHSPKALAKCATRLETDAMVATAANGYKERMERLRKADSQTMSANDIFDRIARLQVDAYAHEAMALDSMRAEHKKETDSLHERIGRLEAMLEAEKEKNRRLLSER